MKKTILFFLAICLAVTAYSQQPKSQRLVLLEHFTQASCGYCPPWNTAYEALKPTNVGKFVIVRHQVNWPGYDPMNEQYPDVSARVSYYSVTGVPYSRTDGTLTGQMSQTTLNSEYAIASPFTIAVTHTMSPLNDSVNISVEITATTAFTANGALKCHVDLTESHIGFSSAPGSNGETNFYNVIRKMIPDANGTTLAGTWTNGQTQTLNFSIPVTEYIYDLRELEVVAFIQQNGDKRVEQAGYDPKITLVGDANLDAAVSAITNVPFVTCDATFTPSVTLKNMKSTVLTTATIYYQVDGGTVASVPWTGSLNINATASVALPALNCGAAGLHTLKTWVSDPNGPGMDFFPVNNSKSIQYSVPATAVLPPVTQGFEATTFPPAGGWLVYNPGNDYTWQRDNSASGFGLSTAAVVIPFFAIASGFDEMFLPPVDLTTLASPKLLFSHAHCRYASESDKLEIMVSKNCGATWTTLYNKAGATLATAPLSTTGFVPTASQWKHDTVDLTTMAGEAQVLIKFKGTSAYGNNLWVDDINLANFTASVSENTTNGNSMAVYPNPFSGSTTIDLNLSNNATVVISMFNVLGELVYTADQGSMSAGNHNISLDGTSLQAGIYYINAKVDGYTLTQKVSVIK